MIKSVLPTVISGSHWEMCDKHDVRFEWVKGHAGHPENERCDNSLWRPPKPPTFLLMKPTSANRHSPSRE